MAECKKARRANIVSKGKRISCHKNHKPATKAIEGNLNTAMREAFLSTSFPDSIRFSRLGAIVIKAAQNIPKLTADQQRGWSTKLSFRTFKELQADGVLA